ncbi:MAG TPA: HYR domain-containing protein, partial [Nitrospiria bacterium]|nr:HYR domain-containing protein [Nitrospiria bacterium]
IREETVTVTIQDTIAPGITPPLPITVEQSTAAGTPETDPLISSFLGGVQTDDICDAAPVVTHDAPAVFPLGITPVTFSVTDASGNTSVATSSVTVVDTTPPSITASASVTVEQQSLDGTPDTDLVIQNLLSSVAGSDICDIAPVVSHDAPSVFPLGTTVITFTATDASGNSSTDTRTVTVQDTQAPALAVPPAITVEQSEAGGVSINEPEIQNFLNGAVSNDVCDIAPSLSHDAPAVFPPGTTTVSFTSTDSSGNLQTLTSSVTVVDTTPPSATPQNASTDEDVPVIISLEGNDPNGNCLTFSITGPPVIGTLSPVISTGCNSAEATYTSPLNFNGNDGFTFTVNDGTFTSGDAFVAVTINPVNDPPVAAGDTGSFIKNSTDNPVNVLLNDSDVDGDP